MYRDYCLFVLSRDILLYRPVIRSSLTSIAHYPTVYTMRCSSTIGNASEQVPVLPLQWEAGERSVFARRGSTTTVVIECVPVAFSSFIGGLGHGCLPNQKPAAPLVDVCSIRRLKDGDGSGVILFGEGRTRRVSRRCSSGRCWRCGRARRGTFAVTSMVCTS